MDLSQVVLSTRQSINVELILSFGHIWYSAPLDHWTIGNSTAHDAICNLIIETVSIPDESHLQHNKQAVSNGCQ